MAILVTRPDPDAESTAAALRGRGFDVMLAPALRFEPVAVHLEANAHYDAVIITSANALRGIAPQLGGSHLLALPLFAVGEHTASAARRAGFAKIIVANGDVASLRDRLLAAVKAKEVKKTGTMLYLAGADVASDLAADFGAHGVSVVTQTTYRMVPVTTLPDAVSQAFAANGIEAVLHYSRRSARAFLDAARGAGVEISALSIPQCCISAAVAAVLRDAGAAQVMAAASPDENAMFQTLDRALGPRSG
jgi:uroporphyrinogen-III synthase